MIFDNKVKCFAQICQLLIESLCNKIIEKLQKTISLPHYHLWILHQCLLNKFNQLAECHVCAETGARTPINIINDSLEKRSNWNIEKRYVLLHWDNRYKYSFLLPLKNYSIHTILFFYNKDILLYLFALIRFLYK